jgi:hypothetical protein
MAFVRLEEDEELNKKLAQFTDRFNDLKSTISELRKHGTDTYTVELLLSEFAPSVKYVKISSDLKDLEAVERIINNIEKEILAIKSGSDFGNAISFISDAYELLRQGNKNEAAIIYRKLMEIYVRLSKDQKKILYKSCVDINNKISKDPVLSK